MYTLKQLVSDTENICRIVGRNYQVEYTDLFSYCLERLKPLHNRIDQTKSERVIRAYVKSSIRGYCLHCIRDTIPLIKTPRGSQHAPFTFVPLLDCDQHYS